jgi:hypothetical protein
MTNLRADDLRTTRGTLNPFVFLAFSLFLLYGFGYETLYQRLITQVEGAVVTSRDVHTSNNPRYITEYTFRTPDGHETKYVAGSSDASLPQSMPVGTSITKRKWHLDYERDGKNVSDFPAALYVMTVSAAVALLLWSIRLWQQQHAK